jgi:hypothetical protein
LLTAFLSLERDAIARKGSIGASPILFFKDLDNYEVEVV